MSSHSLSLSVTQDADEILDMPNSCLEKFPDENIAALTKIKFIYLEGNSISDLPDDFFQNLPLLEWLDMRQNNLKSIPTTGLAGHQNLQVLLVLKNRIKTLPVELVHVPMLTGLQIAGNPIENVPFEVISAGVNAVLLYLRQLSAGTDSVMPACETIIKNATQSSCKIRYKDRLTDKSFSSETLVAGTISKSFCKRSETRSTSKGSLQQLNRKRTKLVTRADIVLGEKNQNEKTRLTEMLEKQSQLLQRIKDAEAMKCWRKMYTLKKSKFLDNFQYSPSRNFLDKSPFDVDQEMLAMLNRADIYKSLKDYDDYYQRKELAQRQHNSPLSTNIVDLEQKIASIREQLEVLDLHDLSDHGDYDYSLQIVSSRIKEIDKLRQVLHKLREEDLKIL